MIVHCRQIVIAIALTLLLSAVLATSGVLLGVRLGILSIPRMAVSIGPFVLASDAAGPRQLDTRPSRIHFGQTRDYMAATVAIPIIEDRSYWIAVFALRRPPQP